MSKEKPKSAEKQLRVRDILPEENDLKKAQYESALGRLTNNFSLLHFFLETFSWELWGLNNRSGLVLTRDLPTKQLVIKLRESARDAIARNEDQTQFKVLLNRVGKAAERRNQLLHSLWLIQDGKPVSCFDRKRGVLQGEDAPSVDDINKTNHSILEIINDFIEFIERKPLKPAVVSGLERLARGKDT